MNEKMENAVRSVLKLDPEFDPVRTDAAIQVLKGRSLSSMRAVDKFDHAVPREEAAKNLNVDIHTVDAWVRSGRLRRIMGSGSRAVGISAVSLKTCMEERHAEAMRRAEKADKRKGARK